MIRNKNATLLNAEVVNVTRLQKVIGPSLAYKFKIKELSLVFMENNGHSSRNKVKKLYRNVSIFYTTNHSNVVVSIGGMVQCFILKVCEKIGKL